MSLTSYEVGDDILRLYRRDATYLSQIEDVVRRRLGPGEPILVVPFHVALYPILNRQSPTWGLYLTRPGTDREQAEMIRRLEEQRVDWALVVDARVDGREDLLFRNTHPIVWNYLQATFDRLEDPQLPRQPPHHLFRRRLEAARTGTGR